MEDKFYSGSTINVHPRPPGGSDTTTKSTGGPRPGLQVTEGAREPHGTDAAREALRAPLPIPARGCVTQPRIQLKGCGPGADRPPLAESRYRAVPGLRAAPPQAQPEGPGPSAPGRGWGSCR